MSEPRPIFTTPPAIRTITGLPLAIWILDHLSGERAPVVPGMFEKAMEHEDSCIIRQRNSEA